MTTKAQQIRSKRLELKNQSIIAEAEKIFDWILDLIDADNKRGYFHSIKFCLYHGETKLRPVETDLHDQEEYCLTEFILNYDKNQLFKTLKKVVEREEGFNVTLDLDATYWTEKAIILEVDVE